jgi:hypothetical protein
LSRSFANALPDDGLKVWARGDAFHFRFLANAKDKPDIAALELPEDDKKIKVGHAWGSYWLARRSAVDSGDRNAEKKVIDNWLPVLRPFGLAGVALGLQER